MTQRGWRRAAFAWVGGTAVWCVAVWALNSRSANVANRYDAYVDGSAFWVPETAFDWALVAFVALGGFVLVVALLVGLVAGALHTRHSVRPVGPGTLGRSSSDDVRPR